MAFGKNPAALSTVGSFRQLSGQFTKNGGGKKKSGGGIPYFVDMYRPTTAGIDLIRLVQGEHLQDQVQGEGADAVAVQVVMPFIKFVEHYDGTMQKGITCSAGPFAGDRTKRAACHGCDIFWSTVSRNAEGRLESSRISRQNKYAFSVFDYGVYHKMENFDAEGKVKVNSVTKEPYFNWTKCEGERCDACRANKESRVGNMTHWPINYTQLQILRGAEVDIGKSCTVCGHKNCIVSEGWECSGCGECVIDMSSTELRSDELLKMTDEPCTCPACHEVHLLKEVYTCRTCAPRGHMGIRASLFDVDLNVKLVIPGPNQSKILQVMGWSDPHPPAEQFIEVMKPIDLVARYAPTPLDVQAEKLGVRSNTGPKREPVTGGTQVPGTPSGAAGATKQYTNPYAPKQ